MGFFEGTAGFRITDCTYRLSDDWLLVGNNNEAEKLIVILRVYGPKILGANAMRKDM